MACPSPADLLDEVRLRAAAAGLDLVGLVDVEEFDGSQPRGRRVREVMPSCGTAVVLARGGAGHSADHSAWHDAGHSAWRDAGHSAGHGDGAAPERHRRPADAGARQRRNAEVAAELCALLAARGYRCAALVPRQCASISFDKLAEVAGLGTVSPVFGRLIHPDYGTWIVPGAVLLVEGAPFRAPPPSVFPSYQPCAACASHPCAAACPADAFASGALDLRRCAEHRHRGGCADFCAARAACPVGSAHRFTPAEESLYHAQELSALRRNFGLGLWALVPQRLRGTDA